MAASFQQAGITALTYDPRGLGESDGTPRCDIDPVKQVGDYHDALTFLQRRREVDPDRIAYWGFSFNGVIALNAAALDKRARCVIAVSPLTDLSYPEDQRAAMLADALRDRESQLAGGEPGYVPVVGEDGTCPYGWGPGTTMDEYNLTVRFEALFPTYRNRMSIQSHYRIAAWRPFELMSLVAPTPVMILTAEKDLMSLPEKQKELFDTLEGPKEHIMVPDRGHMDIFSGSGAARLLSAQIDFVRKHTTESVVAKATL